MVQQWFSASGPAWRGLAGHGRIIALAGLGLCAVPLVLLVLIWRDIVLVAGMAPLLAIGSATVAAIATLVGLELLLRPVARTGHALRNILGTAGEADLRVAAPTDRLMQDAQRLIDELIVLRADKDQPESTAQDAGRRLIAAALQPGASTGRAIAQAVLILRIGLRPRPGSDAFVAGSADLVAELAQRVQRHFSPPPLMAILGDCDLGLVLPLELPDEPSLLALSKEVATALPKLSRPMLSDAASVAFPPYAGSQSAEFTAEPVVPVLLLGMAAHDPATDPLVTLDHAIAAVGAAAPAAPVVMHGPDMRDPARDRAQLQLELRSAIRHQEFELYFQPIMDVAAGLPIGAEALIRWNSPRRGFVAPGMFIPAAEACGLIDPIGEWVLTEACRQAAAWGPGMRVAVNLGARQFLDEDLGWHVAEALTAARIKPAQLELGVTERVALIDPAHSRETILALRDLGVQVAIDDLGTGAANLRDIAQLPFDTLKIDRSFVTDVHLTPASQAICDALVALGTGLGCAVLAEGTEKAEEVAYLSRRGCSLFQGYYFARPVAAQVLAATFDNLRLRKAG